MCIMQVSLTVVWCPVEVTTVPAQGLWHCCGHCWHLPMAQAACVTSAASVFFPFLAKFSARPVPLQAALAVGRALLGHCGAVAHVYMSFRCSRTRALDRLL